MTNFNKLASEAMAVVGVIDPDAYTADAYSTGWIDASEFDSFMAVVFAGELGDSATINAKLEQAPSANGAGAEDITGKAITQLTEAGDDDSDKQAIINLKPEEMVGATLSFKDGTATHFRLTVTVGTATSDAGAVVFGLSPRYTPTADLDLDSVAEIVA